MQLQMLPEVSHTEVTAVLSIASLCFHLTSKTYDMMECLNCLFIVKRINFGFLFIWTLANAGA